MTTDRSKNIKFDKYLRILIRLWQFLGIGVVYSWIQIAGFRDRALEQETDHVVLGLPDELDDFRREEVSVLFQKPFRLVDHASSEMVDRETNRVRFRPHVELGLDVVVKFLCNIHFLFSLHKNYITKYRISPWITPNNYSNKIVKLSSSNSSVKI